MKINNIKIKININNYYFTLVALPAIISCLNSLFTWMGIEALFNVRFIYMLFIIYTLIVIFSQPFMKKNILVKNTYLLCCIYLVFLFFLIISHSEARKYFFTTKMFVVYLIYLPAAIFILSQGCYWHDLFNDTKILRKADIIILVSYFIKYFQLNPKADDYMSYSYNLLPLWGIVLIGALVHKKYEQWIIIVVSLVQGILYGSRGAVLFFLALGVIIYIYMVICKRSIKTGFFMVAIVGSGYYFLQKLLNGSQIKNSYILNRLDSGVLLESNTRKIIYFKCREAIKGMGLSINGLFYDRTILPDDMYSHNIVYEVLLTFGWILGLLFLVWIAYLIVNAIRINFRNEKIYFILYIIFTLLMRYLISGSIFDEGNFYIFVGSIYSYSHIKNIKGKRKHEEG